MKKGVDIFNPKLMFSGNPPEAAPNTTQPEQPIRPATQESLQHPAGLQQGWQFAGPQGSGSSGPVMESIRGNGNNEQDTNATTNLQPTNGGRCNRKGRLAKSNPTSSLLSSSPDTVPVRGMSRYSSDTAQRQQICRYCSKPFHSKREYNKHVKTHEKPIKCAADKNCRVAKAENRDMERHYISAHPDYAAQRGINNERLSCNTPGCKRKFTRHDNLLKHHKKYHQPT
ncbi:hypothetical protein CDV31_016418 [Fusarium ambrosium]|uniref:C2H2-type domain-containing protein n=1 Tax=Fusarium ambrosium TaxID=131363 RepID=A0A428S977_9HYPO|nr:hypothetical protein CDV31_016418 [Fusarium ambrosium]